MCHTQSTHMRVVLWGNMYIQLDKFRCIFCTAVSLFCSICLVFVTARNCAFWSSTFSGEWVLLPGWRFDGKVACQNRHSINSGIITTSTENPVLASADVF